MRRNDAATENCRLQCNVNETEVSSTGAIRIVAVRCILRQEVGVDAGYRRRY